MKTSFCLLSTIIIVLQMFTYSIVQAQSKENNTAACAVLPASLSKHLVAYYPFCGNANDQSGNNNHPSVNTASLTTDRFGNANSAYFFDGSVTQYIKGSCANYPENKRTISIWFKLKDLTNPNNEIMGYGGGSCGTSFFIAFNESNHPGTYTATGHCEVNNCSTPSSYPPSKQWNNLIVTTGDGQTKFYLNGVIIDSFAATFTNTSVAGKDFAFGSIPAPDGLAPYVDVNVYPMKGSLDDIVIYNTVFDAKKVNKLYKFFRDAPVLNAASSKSFYQQGDAQMNNTLAYPNPSKGILTIAYKSIPNGALYSSVYDTYGKNVFTKKVIAKKETTNYQLDLSFLKSGIYFLELSDGRSQKERLHFIIEK